MLFGCSGGETAAVEPLDVRVDEATLPAADLVFWGAETTIEPLSDVMICTFGTYAGEDVGLTSEATWQADRKSVV